MPSDPASLEALKSVISEVDLILETTPDLPQNRTGRSRELHHWAAVVLWFAYYNLCRIHKTLRVTPAIEAGITDHVWDLQELLN